MTTPESDGPGADFAELDGVGPKTADALHAIGISTMSQLARGQVADISRRLGQVGMSIPESRIIDQRWLFQALARETGPEGPGPSAGTDPSTDELDQEDPAEVPWIEHATFIICFDRRSTADGEQWQTRVWDTSSLVEEEIPGTAPAPWVDFIVDAAGLPSDG